MELALRPVPLFHLEPLAGIQPQAESNSRCPSRETAGLVRWEILTDRCSHCKWCVKPEWPSADPRQKPLSGRTPTQSRAKATFPVSPTFASDG